MPGYVISPPADLAQRSGHYNEIMISRGTTVCGVYGHIEKQVVAGVLRVFESKCITVPVKLASDS